MKIDFKHPKYVLPLIVLPFLLILFYAFKDSFGPSVKGKSITDSLQSVISPVSRQVSEKGLSDKLGALQDRFRQSDGYSAVNGFDGEHIKKDAISSLYDEREKAMLDSAAQLMKQRYQSPVGSRESAYIKRQGRRDLNIVDGHDEALVKALAEINKPRSSVQPKTGSDPMQLFCAQLSIIDSIQKANELKNPVKTKPSISGNAINEMLPVPLRTQSAQNYQAGFNTVSPATKPAYISAIIDEELTVFSGSRLRIRLLEDIMAGRFLVKKGTHLYAQLSAFNAQRAFLSISSVFADGSILPIKLDVYDYDGLRGIYVPASAFREFTKELSSSSFSGVSSPDELEVNNKLVMSTLSGMFQSVNTAVNKLIRRNKAKIKYNTLIYLIDSESLRSKQNIN